MWGRFESPFRPTTAKSYTLKRAVEGAGWRFCHRLQYNSHPSTACPTAYGHIYIRLSSDAESPLSLLLAHTRARFEISDLRAKLMVLGHETPRAHQGGAPRAGGVVGTILATCAPSPFSSKVLRKPEAFPNRGLGPPRLERVRGVESLGRSEPGDVA